MAKRKPAAPPPPTPDRVAKFARAGDYAAALDAARALVQLAPTPDHQALLRRTLADAAAFFADHDRAADFNRALADAADLDPADRAVLLARGGRTADALALADDASRPRVFAAAADRAVRHHTNAYLPPELHVGFDAVLTAFRKHEAGDEAGAREALEPIGLRSPFLEWKVLVRGLMAYAAADDARAAENFARLDPARVPARLAAPLRFAVDPAFKQAQPADSAAALAARLRKLTPSPAVEHLRAIARELGRDKPLTPAFRVAELVVPQLKAFAPDLVPRLANCLYHAVVTQGQPDDLAKYRKLFGSPPDDPNFHKLQAMIGEAIGDPAGTHAHWLKYEAWLATYPPGWPAAVADRARAEVWTHLGVNASKVLEEPEEEFGLFAPPLRKKKPPKPLDPPAATCFGKAAELAPDSPDATRRHFEALLGANRPADAEAAARAYLARKPDDAFALVALANLIRQQGRAAEAAAVMLRALPLNPLDKPTRVQTASVVVAAARAALAGGKLADAKAALAVLDKHDAFLTEMAPAGRQVLRAVALQKLGRADEAAAARAAALAVPGARLSASYRLMVDSQLAKLKPADKKAADAQWAADLVPEPLPQEVLQLFAAYDLYRLDAVTYRGQKTHEKKVLDQAWRCAGTAGPVEEFEKLLDVLVRGRQEFKAGKKLADALMIRFPTNPALVLSRAEAGMGLGEREYQVENRLRRAKALADAATEPRHRELAGRIDELLKQYAAPFDFLDAFFGRR